MHERHPMTALRLVEVGRGEQDRDALARELGQRVPELAPGDRIHSRRRLVEQQHARLRHQRAGQRQLLLHAAAQAAGQSVEEALHPEHGQVALPAPRDLGPGHAPQLADVAQVLGHAQVRVQAERLGEIAHVLARRARRSAEQLGLAGGGLHHAAQDLERRGLARPVRPDEPEDLAHLHLEVDAAHRLGGAVALGQAPRPDRGCGRLARPAHRGTLTGAPGARATPRPRRGSPRRPACPASRSPPRRAGGASRPPPASPGPRGSTCSPV